MNIYITLIILLCHLTYTNAQRIAFNIETDRGYFFQNSSGDDIEGFSFRPVYRQTYRFGIQYQHKKLGVNASVMIPGTGSEFIIYHREDTSYYLHSNAQYNIGYRLDVNYRLYAKRSYDINASFGFYYGKETQSAGYIFTKFTKKNIIITNINSDKPFTLFCPVINFQFLKRFKRGNKIGLTIEGRYNGSAFGKRTRNYNDLTVTYLDTNITKNKRIWSNENSMNIGIVYYFKPLLFKH